jgi:uncharacterized protein YpbB
MSQRHVKGNRLRRVKEEFERDDAFGIRLLDVAL